LQFAKSRIDKTRKNINKRANRRIAEKKNENSTFLFNGRALNFGIFAIISSSSSALLFTLAGRIR